MSTILRQKDIVLSAKEYVAFASFGFPTSLFSAFVQQMMKKRADRK